MWLARTVGYAVGYTGGFVLVLAPVLTLFFINTLMMQGAVIQMAWLVLLVLGLNTLERFKVSREP